MRLNKKTITLCLAATSIIAAAKTVPEAKIPRLTVPVKLDGILSNGEWSDAAVIRNLHGNRNKPTNIPHTEFYLKYDNNALYVGVVCHETTKGYPEAYKRPWNDLLFRNDDAVQVVIGTRDKNVAVHDTIDAGGYEGAMNSRKSPVDFYYQFTVNASGYMQRTFNEAPLKHAMFESKVKNYPGQKWTVEFNIPFASCGISNAANHTFGGNLIRFRPPETAGWHYPNFGGYYPYPFGKFIFLNRKESASKTVEKNIPQRQKSINKSCKLSIQYSPLSGAIIGKAIISGYKNLTGILEISGMTPVRKKLKQTNEVDHDANKIGDHRRTSYVICKIKPGTQPQRKATFRVIDASGNVLGRIQKECKAVKAPEWLGTKNGTEYVEKKFPAPWTMPKVNGHKVELLDKIVIFNKFSLPKSIKFKKNGEDLLAGSPEIAVETATGKLEFNCIKDVCKEDGNKIRCESTLTAKTASLKTKAVMEPDGFTVCKFKLNGIPPSIVKKISLRIPLKKENAKFIMPGILVQNIGQLTGAGYRNSARPTWVGVYDKGLYFNFDTKLFRAKDVRHQIEVIEGKDTTYLTFNFIDGLGQLAKDTIFRFFLQPTPTKPRPDYRIRKISKWKWERWSQWHGYPDLSKIPEIKKWLKGLNDENKLGLLYTCQGLQEDAPFFKEFRSDLELQPRWRYYRLKGTDCFATSKRGPEGDLQLWGWKKLIDSGVRGLVSDGLIPAWGDSNPAHANGGGMPVSISWDNDLKSRVVAQRDFVKRMRGLFTNTGEPYCIVAHTGGGIDVNLMSFIDGYMEGEQTQRYNRGYFLPLPIYAVGFCGTPWGWRSMFWAKRWRNYQSVESSLAYALLFNTELIGNKDIENPNYDLEIYKNFPSKTTTFIPFWKKNDYVKLKAEDSLCSLYINGNHAMAVVSNPSYYHDNLSLDLSALYPGKNISVRDELTSRKLGNIRLIKSSLPPHSCKVFMIDIPNSPEKTNMDRKMVMRAKNSWTSNSAANKSVEYAYPVAAADVKDLASLQTKPYKGTAEATLQYFETGDSCSLELTIIPQRRFYVSVGSMKLYHDHTWFILNNGVRSTVGITNPKVPIKTNSVNKLVIMIKDNELNAWINGKALIKDHQCNLPLQGNEIKIGTWFDDKLLFKADLAANYAVDININKVFNISGFDSKLWEVNVNNKKGHADFNLKMPKGKSGLRFGSRKNAPAATATFTPLWGKNFYADLDIVLPSRFRIKLGEHILSYGSNWAGYGWYVRGPVKKRGYGRVIRQVPLKKCKLANLKISMKNGVLDVLYDNIPVVQKLPLDIPDAGNRFALETWWTDKIGFTTNRISTHPEKIISSEIKHPVLAKGGIQ